MSVVAEWDSAELTTRRRPASSPDKGPYLNAVQCRMARAALGLSVRSLAKAAQVSPGTVTRLEYGEDLKPRTVRALQHALEAAGVVLIEEDEASGAGPGVRLAARAFDPEPIRS